MSLSRDLYDHFADARRGLLDLGRAVGDGLTLAAEILCPRDHTAEERLRSWESAAEAVEDEICDEADNLEADELSPEEAFGFFALGLDPADLTTKGRCPLEGAMCNCTGACLKSSAAVSAAADPSPAVSHEDLSAHLTGAAIRANTGHPDVLIDAFASSLLDTYHITLQ